MTKAPLDRTTAAFHAFIYRMAPSRMPLISDPEAWEAQAAENRAELRRDLEELGLAEHIDWEVPQ